MMIEVAYMTFILKYSHGMGRIIIYIHDPLLLSTVTTACKRYHFCTTRHHYYHYNYYWYYYQGYLRQKRWRAVQGRLC